MNASRAGNLGNHCVGLKAGCNKPFFLFTRPTPTAFNSSESRPFSASFRGVEIAMISMNSPFFVFVGNQHISGPGGSC